MIHLIRPDINFDFLGKSKPFVLLSTILAVLSIVLLFTKGLNYGIDFTGGAEVQVKLPPAMDISKLRDSLSKGGLENPHIVSIGDPRDNEFLVKVQATEDKLK